MNIQDSDNPVEFNQLAWDRMALAGNKLYRAVDAQQVESARSGNWSIRVTPQKPVPETWLKPVTGKKVLCLAGGGGNQAILLSAAGAEVTVYDISQNQLQRDIDVASREDLTIRTIQGDMRDLGVFDDREFDLVINPCSVCFIPDVECVWKECFRVLKDQGSLITGFINPIYYLFDARAMDRGNFEVRHSIPYSDFDLDEDERQVTLGDDRPREFGHTLDQLIGMQIKAGFTVTGFYEDGWGQNDKLSSYTDVFCATKATNIAASANSNSDAN